LSKKKNDNNSDEEILNKFLVKIESDPVLFCKEILHVSPFSYQEAFLKDPSKRIVMCAGRRVGKSMMTGAKALWFVLSHEKVTVLIVSATLRQSIMMFDTILDYVSDNALISRAVVRQTRTLIRFKNGSKILALPCGKGKGLRGQTCSLIVCDEAAFMPEEVISEVLLPMLATTDGYAIMLSTPWTKDHIFYKAFTSAKWSKYHYKTSDNPMVKPEFLEEQRELVGEQRYLQEYEAQFTDDGRAYFPSALLQPCIHTCDNDKCEYCELFSPDPPANIEKISKIRGSDSLFAGYDPGGKGDPAAFVVLEKMKDDILRIVLVKTYLAKLHGKKLDDPNLYTRFTAEISDVHKKIRLRRLWIDQTGLGQPIIEQCKGLDLPAEGLNLSSKSKEEILANLRILFENKKIILPSGDRDLELQILSNLNCIEFERKPAGGFAFSHPEGTHDDIAYALALAAWGATRTGGIVIMMKDEPADKPPSWRWGLTS
jgi:phage FluMu gp28-like protein